MNKFEQLIEYVINDEEQKARELFHDIVVEKSRQIYEEMMQEESEAEEQDDAEEEIEEGMESLGGDQSDDLIDDIEAEEEGIGETDGEMDIEVDGEEELAVDGEESSEDLEDRVVDLEDKLDELMAEFESLMGDEAPADDELDADMDVEVGGEEDFGAEGGEEDFGAEGGEEELDMMENVSLKAVAKPSNTEEASNKKSVVAANSGAKGAVAKPVSSTGEGGTRPAPTAKDLGVNGPQDAAKGAFKSAAPKAQNSQAAGTNTKSPLPR